MENSIILPENINVPSKYCVLMLNILNIVSKRGAINPDEFAVIGDLVEFLKKELKLEEQRKQLPPVPE